MSAVDPKAISEALRCVKTVTAGAASLVAGMCEKVRSRGGITCAQIGWIQRRRLRAGSTRAADKGPAKRLSGRCYLRNVGVPDGEVIYEGQESNSD